MRTHLVVMGVSGCGKSTVAAALQGRLGWVMAEGDDFHSEANVAKMRDGIPLTDEDRRPWLEAIAAWTSERDAAGDSTVVTCSALKRSYRDLLRAAPGRTRFVHLTGSRDLLAQRMRERSGHFMPGSLLDSQLATLEPLQPDEQGVTLDIGVPIDTIVEQALTQLVLTPRGA
jgi:carbohydrate kinase (thermoresistant glucokinase family)